jgi:thioredoxin 1
MGRRLTRYRVRLLNNPVMTTAYENPGPGLAEVESLPGSAVLEFGTPWCGYCRAAQAPIAQALTDQPHVRHLKVEDGSGRPLGRAFRVKLWPTLVFLRDGREVARLVRPQGAAAIRDALAQTSTPG